jgi:Reverse transcriptase (RNA-dependent DNA polymerase)
VLHGNKEQAAEDIRSDAASIHFSLIRMILTIAAMMNFELAGVDAKKAYHYSGRAPRNNLVRPPAECLAGRRSIWRLLNLPYGLVGAGRQWQLAFERWLLDIVGFVTVPSMPQVFVMFDPSGSFLLHVGKVVDDVIIAGAHKDIERFLEALKSRWIIGKAEIANRFMFNGVLIERDPSTGAICMSMRDYVKEKVHVIPLAPERRRQQADAATAEEKKLHRSMAGVLGFLGQGVLPMATFVFRLFAEAASFNCFRIGPRKQNDQNFTQPRSRCTYSCCRRRNSFYSPTRFSDASFNIMCGELYGQGGYISGLLVPTHARDAFYFLDQYSSRLKRVVYSSFGAEILACAEADDRLFALRSSFQELLSRTFESELLVDSKGLYSCISTLSNNKEYRLRRTVARIRESFDSGDLDILRWIRGIPNLVDGQTKFNLASWEMLHRTLSTGLLQVDELSAPSRGDGDGWHHDLPQTLHHGNS